MVENINADICVIGAGSGGLSVAAGASQMGANVVLVERDLMGGDCLNFGCVPSKALLAAAHRAQDIREADMFGIRSADPAIDMQAVHDHVRSVIDGIAPHDSVERFEGLGVRVVQAPGRFLSGHEIAAGDFRIQAKYFVIATGSSAMVPPIPGLKDTPYFTNETIFNVTERIDHLLVVGGGPIGAELAQAHRRLGAKVTLIEMDRFMGKDDPEAADIVRRKLISEGVSIHEKTSVVGSSQNGDIIQLSISRDGQTQSLEGSHLLIAAGRKANVESLDLDRANVKFSPRGINVDERLRTSNKHIYAIGDVTGGYQFTHMAGYDAGIVIRNILFKLPAKVSHNAVPWVSYTDPELAQVGLTEQQAIQKLGSGKVTILRWSYGENDRARAEKATDGFAKVLTDPKGRILGATIVGKQAGELISLWTLAIQQKMKIGAMAGLIIPYPTLSEVSKRAAGSYYTPKLFSERMRKIVRFLLKF
ncbi:dihydrolipoyl dehydrogenase family protein [Aestuariispira insulae]|uniref:Pyruvate/2-oxoglutarate dehydrogenase complex dihydrolipoamide dehydrogenase (E3) component n=1 Tax=Aestuariispira insulae TaxID=1461337 RepID=A0A3D9HG98_9PROT|nr:FAD-dependent oxidoreductase [Aestuariispira insulae]RED48016.1 pyruvate/2-oxoglutarate dehydrogenase complex dihydrolipoamide dehydrogenase (E3) component [Aestuariispira insulae]